MKTRILVASSVVRGLQILTSVTTLAATLGGCTASAGVHTTGQDGTRVNSVPASVGAYAGPLSEPASSTPAPVTNTSGPHQINIVVPTGPHVEINRDSIHIYYPDAKTISVVYSTQ